MARDAGYLLIGEGESDAWTCWYHTVPYLGIPGSDFQKCLKQVDPQLLPAKIYILLEADQKTRLLSNGTGFYKNIHSALRAMKYQGEIFCIDFKKSTDHKDPSDLHVALCKENQGRGFNEIIEQAMSQALPGNDSKEEAPSFAIQDEKVLKALVDRQLQGLYALAPEITDMPDMEQATIKLAAKDIWKNDFPSREFDNLLKAAKEDNERKKQPKPTPISLYDLRRKQFDPIKYIVPDVLPAGLIILGGKQKIGKSWLDLNLGIAVATGGIALGHYKVEQGDVLYMALEDTDRRLQSRTEQLLAPGEEWPKAMEVVTEWPRLDSGGLQMLEEWVQSRPNARMVIIDPWVKVKPRVKSRQGETGYDADYEALAGIKALADKYGVCMLVQFHLRKASADDPFDEVNATTGATACADGFISLKRGRGDSEATLYASGRDYKEEVNLALSFKDGMWKVLGDGQAAVYYALSGERREIIDLLNGALNPMEPKNIATLLNASCDSNRIRRLLFKMKDDGQVEWKEEGEISGYISLIPSPNQTSENMIVTNRGNAVTAVTPITEVIQPSGCNDEDTDITDPFDAPIEPNNETSVTPVTAVTALPQNEALPIPMELLQEYRDLYQQITQVPTEQLAPHGTLLWNVPSSDIKNGMVSPKEYGIRLQALGKSRDLRKVTAGRDELLRKLGQLKG